MIPKKYIWGKQTYTQHVCYQSVHRGDLGQQKFHSV